MNLAQLIHKALSNPQYRLALETGTLDLTGTGLSSHEISAAAEAIRHSRIHNGDNADHFFRLPIGDPNSIGWRNAV